MLFIEVPFELQAKDLTLYQASATSTGFEAGGSHNFESLGIDAETAPFSKKVIASPANNSLPIMPGIITIAGRFTVTLHTANLELSAAEVAVMVTVPGLWAQTSPVVPTAAMLLLLDVHTIFLFVAFDGTTVAVSCAVSFTDSSRVPDSMHTCDTAI